MKKFLFSFLLIGTFASYALYTQQSAKTAETPVLIDKRQPFPTAADAAAVLTTSQTPADGSATPAPAPMNDQLQLQAQGKVVIKSTYSAPMVLIKTTRLLSTDGKVYRLASQIDVPANSQVTADVYADQNGSLYAIGPTTFTVPGLDASLQSFVTVSSPTPFVMAQPVALATAAPAPTPAPAPQPVPAPKLVPPPAPPKPKAMYKDGTFVGDSADAYYGNIQVQAVIRSGRIADVQFLDHPQDRNRSIYINDQAMPWLTTEAIQAQNANVDIVSGATDTSRAFIESLGVALAQARN